MICILLSTYNGEKYLKQQLDSILDQKKVQLSIIIRDDGSSDDTCEIIKEYQLKYPNIIIDVIWGGNCGFALSFTELVKRANLISNEYGFKYFAFADQDDYWLEDKLYNAVYLLESQNENIPVTYCSNCTLVDKNLMFIKNNRAVEDIQVKKGRAIIENIATGCTMVFNKEALYTYADNVSTNITRHDFFMYQICAFMGYVIYDKNSFILYRQHGTNQVGGILNVSQKIKRILKYDLFKASNMFDILAASFLDSFRERLTIEDIDLLTKVSNYRKSILSRLRLIFDNDIKFTRFDDNLFMIIKVLFGKF